MVCRSIFAWHGCRPRCAIPSTPPLQTIYVPVKQETFPVDCLEKDNMLPDEWGRLNHRLIRAD